MKLGIDRRTLGKAAALLVGAAAGPVNAALGTDDDVRVLDLKVDNLTRPLGLETRTPRLSWRLESARRNVRQSAYRILVDEDPDELRRGRGGLWDSGRVSSDRSLGVIYGGPPLRSRQICWWTVQVWDETGAPLSTPAPSHWEMGLLAADDWSATWLAAERAYDRDNRRAGVEWIWGSETPGADLRRFRRRVTLPASAHEARLIVAARERLDALYVDGAARPVPPAQWGWAPAPAQEVEIGPLGAGEHLIAAQVSLTRPQPIDQPPKGGFAALLWARLVDGREVRVATDTAWETAAGAGGNWSAQQAGEGGWRRAEHSVVTDEFPWPATPAMLFRRPFEVGRPVSRARLYVTALGACDPYLNGAKVSDGLLAPESQDFRKHVLYRAHDVTDLIRPGENVLGAHVGDGWYASAMAPTGRYPFGPGPRRFLAQLELTYADGSREVIASGPGWRTATSAVLASDIYNGETYDARAARRDWSLSGAGLDGWSEAETAEPPAAPLKAQTDAPIRITQSIKPQAISQPAPGVHVVDFGQNFAGFCRLRVTGPAGAKVELRFAEILTADGRVDQSNLRSARATDTYVLRGDSAGETYQPHFTYHGFRYVEVHGFPGALKVDALTGLVIHTDLPITGRLRLGNPLIEQIWRNTVWSQRSNFVGIPTDCPQRDERLGWMGDANVFWDAAAFNMDVYAFTRRFCGDIRDAQASDGAFADFAPSALKVSEEAAPGWADAGVVLPWTAWWRYGDAGIIDEHWPAMARYLGYIRQRNPDGLWRSGRGSDYGDWLALDAKQPGDPTTPKDLVATAWWANSLALVAQMARASGRTSEAEGLQAQHDQVVAAFRSAYVQADGGIGNGSQTSYILALRFGLVPDNLRAAAVERLAREIRRRGALLSTGFLGTPNSLDVLADGGQSALVYDLLLRTDYPSWGYMIRKGATSMWERWNGDTGDVSMNSFNHYAFGAVSGFLFRRIAGIEPTAPGFKSLRIKPVLDRRMKRGGADYHSAMGKISTDWRLTDTGGFRLAVDVPANVTAEVHLPTQFGGRYLQSGRPLNELKPEHGADGLIVQVGSGNWSFSTSGA